MSRVNKTGRSKGGGHFVALYDWMTRSPAWRSLSPAERAVYIELAAIYNGTNNGTLGLGARRAAELCNISKNSAPGIFRTLQERGFIECATPGGFSRKTRHQTEWRLTSYKCDQSGALPTKAFMKWRPGSETRSQTRDATVPNEGQNTPATFPTVPQMGPSAQEIAA